MRREQNDQIVSTSNLRVNFLTKENNNDTIQILQNMQTPSKNDIPKITYDLKKVNSTLHIKLFTNVTKRPIVLIVDTGASITLVAQDTIMDFSPKRNCKIDLCGVTGTDNLIQTSGTVCGYSAIENHILGTTMHLVDRKYAGPADGYLGFDFLSQYKTTIDIENSKIHFKLNGTFDTIETPIKIPSETKPTSNTVEPFENMNFVNILGVTYDFTETLKNSRDINSKKKEFQKYFKAVYHFEQQMNEVEDNKIRGLTSIETNDNPNKHPNKTKNKNINHTPPNSKVNPNLTDENKNFDKITEVLRNEIEDLNEDLIGEFFPHATLDSYKIFALNFDEFVKNEDIIEDFGLNDVIIERMAKITQKLNLEHCTPEDKQFVWTICAAFPNQFYVDGDTLGSTDIIKHEIKLIPGAKPINLRQYRIPHAHKPILQNIIDDYERQNIIEKCQSNFNSPVILVGKKDDNGEKNDFRLVVDYRKLNEISETSNFPIPLITTS